jgi:hypothetical protein
VSSNRWTTATLSETRSDLTSTSVANRFALFAGGYNRSDYSNVIDIFDYLSGNWSTSTLSQPRSLLTSTSLRELAFFAGGQTIGGQVSNVVDIFNSTIQTWNTANTESTSLSTCIIIIIDWRDCCIWRRLGEFFIFISC